MACILLHNFVRIEMPNNIMEETEDDPLSPASQTELDFLDNFNSSEEWDMWRDNFAMSMYHIYVIARFHRMDSRGTAGSVAGKGKKIEKTRRSWSGAEEEVLIASLKDIVTKGFRSENGFRAGYLSYLEAAMKSAFSGTDLRRNPHINSKVRVWKKQYSCLAAILGKSGIGWNDTEHMIEATDEDWEALVKVDNCVCQFRYKRWPFYQDWCEIFGNDRATGERVETFAAAAKAADNMKDSFPNYDDMDIEDFINPFEGADESISVTHTPSSRPSVGTKSNSKKRKQISEEDDQIVAAINNLANITKETMSDLIKEIVAESKKSESNISNAMDSVLDILYTIPELSSDEKVQVAELLVDNPNKLALFLRLDREGRLSLSRRLIAP